MLATRACWKGVRTVLRALDVLWNGWRMISGDRGRFDRVDRQAIQIAPQSQVHTAPPALARRRHRQRQNRLPLDPERRPVDREDPFPYEEPVSCACS